MLCSDGGSFIVPEWLVGADEVRLRADEFALVPAGGVVADRDAAVSGTGISVVAGAVIIGCC